ncbi:MAG: hypothetical protein AAFQ06_06980 [Pseudomonadota bacterium]
MDIVFAPATWTAAHVLWHGTRMDIVIVAATLIFGFAGCSALAGWADRRRSQVGLAGLALSLGLFALAHFGLSGGFTLEAIPLAFVDVAARILN